MICNETYDLGQFNIYSSAIRFTDPCYTLDTWCAGELPAINGKWDSNIGLFRCPNDERDSILYIKTMELMKYIYLDAKNNIMDLYELSESLKKYRTDDTLKSIYDNCVKNEKHKEYIDFLVNEFNELYDKEYDYLDNKERWILSKLFYMFQLFIDNSLYHLILIKELMKIDSSDNIKAISYAISMIGLNIDNNISSAKESYNSGKPKRTLFLRIKHSSLNEYTSFDSDLWKNINSFNVGVDSGQAGFFDLEWFKKYSATYDTTEWEQTYSYLCSLSSDCTSYRNANNPHKKDGGSFEYGCNSHTAYGDGSADLYVIKDVDGNVIEAMYHYSLNDD